MVEEKFDLIDVIGDSLKLAWRHKLLWVFALMIGGGMSFNNFSNFTNSLGDSSSKEFDDQMQEMPYHIQTNSEYEDFNFDDFNNEIQNYETNEEFDINSINSVLGSFIAQKMNVDSSMPPLENEGMPYPDAYDPSIEYPMPELYNPDIYYDDSIPELYQEPELYPEPDFDPSIILSYIPHMILVGISFIIFFLVSISIGLIIKSWATGAFLNGVDSAIKNKTYTLKELGTKGRITAREIVKLNVLLVLIMIVSLIVLSPLILIPVFLFANDSAGLGALFILFTVIALFVVFLAYKATTYFAFRHASLGQMNFMDSLKEGFRVFRSNFLKTLGLMFANCFLTIAFFIAAFIGVFILVLIGGGIIAGLGLLGGEIILALLAIIFGVPFVLAVMVGFTALNAYLATYANFTWSFLFNYATRIKNVDQSSNSGGVDGSQ